MCLIEALGQLPALSLAIVALLLVEGQVGRRLTAAAELSATMRLHAEAEANRARRRQWITDFYQANKLARGTLELAGRRVRLGQIRCPVLNIAAAADTIAPRPTTSAIMRLVGSTDAEELVLEGGHVGTIVGRSARTALWPRVAGWLERHD